MNKPNYRELGQKAVALAYKTQLGSDGGETSCPCCNVWGGDSHEKYCPVPEILTKEQMVQLDDGEEITL